MNLNKVFLFGNLTRDPELRQLPSGQALCSFGLATNRVYKDQAGQRQEQTEFHNIVVFARQAELVSQYLKKGSSAFIEGRLQTRSWVDQNGTKHWRTETVAERVQFGPRHSGGYREQASSPTNQVQQSSSGQEQSPPIIELPQDEEIDINEIPF